MRLLPLLLLAACLTGQAAAQAAEPLRVCMSADNAPLSWVQRQGGSEQLRGLDLRIAQALADSLGRPLQAVPFETEFEKESTLAQEVNALLSAGVCEAVSGYPLIRSDLGPPQRPSARTPDHPGAKRKRERPFVPLGTLVASRAYQAASLGLVLPGPQPRVASPAELAALDDGGALTLGTTSGTLASALALQWQGGALRPRLRSLGQREELLDALAAGRIGAALLPLARFDGWKLSHPASTLVATPWRQPIGVNLGFVMLEGAAPLRQQLDALITAAREDGRLARWAAEEGVSWAAPQSPEIGPGPSLAALLQR